MIAFSIARRHVLVAVLALVFCGCTKLGDTAVNSDANRQAHDARNSYSRLVLSNAADPKTLNPALSSASPTLELSSFLFSYAVRYDEDAKPVPDAITELPTTANGDVSADGLTLTYKLRRGVMWHDGVGDVQCNDLRFTWLVMINPKNNVNTTDGWSDIRNVVCRNPYVAIVHLKRVYAPYLQQLWSVNGNGPILPEHLLATLNDARGSLNTAAYNSAPVGSGPYRFVSWTRGSNVRLTANRDYFAGPPKIRDIIYQIIPDQNTLTTQLQTHEINLAWNLPASSYETVKRISGLTAITPVVYTYDHIDFNLRRTLFADVRLRRALTYAIDRATLLRKLRHGLGELSDSFLDKTLYPTAQTRGLVHYSYDPARARTLLEAAGWRVGSDGIRTRNSQRLSFQISTQVESNAGRLYEEQMQTYWRAIGAEALIKNYPISAFFDNSPAGILAGGKYDVAFYAWSNAPDIDTSALYSGDNFAPHGQNSLFWNNPIATAAMRDANQTVDQRKRIADYAVVQHEFTKDDPSIILWFRKDLEVYPTALKHFTPTPVILTPFWNPSAYTF